MGAKGSSVAVKSSPPPVGLASGDKEEMDLMKGQYNQAKKEVQQIRALESQLMWDMDREERKQTEAEKREEAREIMEWRESQAVGMKEYVEQKTKEERIQELMESKDFQEFKREWKEAKRKDDLEWIKERLEQGMDQAAWNAELQRAAMAERQEEVVDRLEECQDMRDIKANEEMQKKVQIEQDRSHEAHLEMAHKVNQISAEKAELLKNLEMLRSRQKVPAGSNRGAPKKAIAAR